MDNKIKYCALTTISLNMRNFMMPAVEYLSKNGYDVIVGCKEDPAYAKTMPEGVGYIGLNIERGFKLGKTLKTIVRLYKFFKKEKIQMVEYGTENVSFCGSIAAWMAGVPVRIYNHWGARYVGYTGILRQISLFIERTAVLFSTTVRDCSNMNMEMCIKDKVYSRKKAKVLGYGGTVGADFHRFNKDRRPEYNDSFRKKYGIGKDDFVYGDVCFVRKDKGSNELLTAFKNINEKNHNTWLVFVGDIYEEDLPEKALMDWAQNSDRVIFTGRVPDVEHYVASFNCMVHPSYREGLGMVLQEAGAMAVPSITTDIPGPSEFAVNGESVLLVNKADAEDLQEKMEFVLKDKKALESLSDEVYKLVKERYERGVMVQRILADRNELYKNNIKTKNK